MQILLFVVLHGIASINICCGQQISSDKISLSNFMQRYYESQPFEGVKILEDYENKYLISLIVMEFPLDSNTNKTNRIAAIKARKNASIFINGSIISSSDVIFKNKSSNNDTIRETIITQTIKETSNGFIDGIELLTNFKDLMTGSLVFVYYRKMD